MKSKFALPLFLLLIPFSGAQSVEEGCTADDPCPWVFDVGSTGILVDEDPGWEFTTEDWLELDIWNFDSVEHKIWVGSEYMRVLPPADNTISEPINFATAGVFQVLDENTGHQVSFTIVEADIVAESSGDRGIPGLAPSAIALALLALVARRQ